MKTSLSLALLLICIFSFTSCAYKKSSYHQVAKNIFTPIFICMPENTVVFENISPIVFKSIWNYFNKLGYNLVGNPKDAYVLKIKIKSLDPMTKFISSDVILYSLQIKMDLHCQVFDKDEKLVTQKDFKFFTLISKPQDTILNPGVFEFEYNKLMQRACPKIEQYFRKYWVKKI